MRACGALACGLLCTCCMGPHSAFGGGAHSRTPERDDLHGVAAGRLSRSMQRILRASARPNGDRRRRAAARGVRGMAALTIAGRNRSGRCRSRGGSPRVSRKTLRRLPYDQGHRGGGKDRPGPHSCREPANHSGGRARCALDRLAAFSGAADGDAGNRDRRNGRARVYRVLAA